MGLTVAVLGCLWLMDHRMDMLAKTMDYLWQNTEPEPLGVSFKF